jgi:hypothetical protein
MITRKASEFGYTEYHEDGYWIEVSSEAACRTVLYHECTQGIDCNILLVDETFEKECHQCGPVSIPDDLWTLYVLLDGRGVYKDVE